MDAAKPLLPPDDHRDTIEAPPMVCVTTEAAPIVVTTISSEETVPLAVPVSLPATAVAAPPDQAAVDGDAPTASQPRPGTAALLQSAIAAQQKEHADRIARQRGVMPIRVPSVSKRYDVVAAPRSSRPLILGAVAFVGLCVAVTAGTIMWARSAVSRAEQAAQPPVVDPVAKAAAVEPTANLVAPVPVAPTAEPAAVAPPEAQPAVGSCSVSVNANVRDAHVFLDGKRHGTAPAVIPAPCNTAVVVEVRHPRYDDFKQPLEVSGEAKIDVRLERGKTALTLSSDPPGAEVTYNGVVLGKTPLVAKVNRYEAGTLWFRAPGLAPDWRKIVPKQKTTTVSVTLKPAP